MTTASDILSAAYNRSSASDPGKLANDTEMLAHANRLYQRLWALYGGARPEEASSVVTLTLGGSPPSVAVPSDAVAIVRLWDDDGVDVALRPKSDANRAWNLAPAMYRIGNSIYSFNRADDPLAAEDLEAQIIPSPTALTTLATAIDARFPPRAQQILIDLLAVYLSVKDDGRDQNEHAKLLSDVRVSAAAFAAEYDLAPSAVSWIHDPLERSKMPA